MKRIASCEFNIDTIAVENELDASILQRSKLYWLIYNKPMEYADLILSGVIKEYIKGASVDRLTQSST